MTPFYEGFGEMATLVRRFTMFPLPDQILNCHFDWTRVNPLRYLKALTEVNVYEGESVDISQMDIKRTLEKKYISQHVLH
jgi:hypothetical protein